MGQIWKRSGSFSWVMDPNVPGAADHVSMKMLREVDGVVVASPTKTHGAYITLLASSGIPVLVEKPMVSSLESAEHIVKKGWDVFVSQPVRYDWLKKPEGLWAIYRQSSGGEDYVSPLWDLAVHDLDIVQFWGESLEVDRTFDISGGKAIKLKCDIKIESSWGSLKHSFFDVSDDSYDIPNSGTAIARQLDDFMVYLLSGQAPERLCTAKQALNVIRVIDSISNGTI